jgi:cell fate (sporulation/competence/biofilm development) regulator YlbF (YheA/YmcA/DUF963 family)
VSTLDEVRRAAEKLAESIKNSDLYVAYQRSYEDCKPDEAMMTRLREFKATETAAWNQCDESISFEDEKKISALFSQLVLNEKTKTFLENEAKLCAMLRDVYRITASASPHIL